MFDPMFVPPRHNEALFRFATTFVPWLGRLFGNVHSLSVNPEDLERVRSVGAQGTILAPNHPTETDPIVMFWLSRELKQRFNFVATREALEPPRGWLMNRIGVYSVIRGFPDRESIRMTRKLLSEDRRKIVIFPEGLVYEHNDRLLDFQAGVAQMGFWALEDQAKAGQDPRISIVPVAIKYRCCASPREAIEGGLRDLEADLGLTAEGDWYARLVRIGSRILAHLERDEGLKEDEKGELQDRISRVRQRLLERVARAIGGEVDERQPPGEQLHQLFNQLKGWVGVLEQSHTEYDERLYRRRMEVAAPLFQELLRLHNFVAFGSDYVASRPTAERFLEVSGRLQKEVLGRVRHQAPLAARVKVAEPVPLHERQEQYRTKKREAVADVTRHVQTTIRGMLDEMADYSTPLTPEKWPKGW